MDVLTISGRGHRLNGDYDCDIVGLLDIASEEALTVREAHFVKKFTDGVRGAEIGEAFLAGDRAVVSALAIVILRRNEKRIEESAVWDYPTGWARFTLGVEEADADPPTEQNETSKTESTPTSSGGMGSYLTLANQEDDQPRTGRPASDTSAISDPAISAI